jgi:threonine dehydrogenase-like Zn-dependent dehydrogenase
MKAAILINAGKMVVDEIPDPEAPQREVVIRVQAVGVCGTDLHIFGGHGNWNFDANGRPIPLTVQPQILGHEFSGEIVEVGREVADLRPGDRVLCDQGRNCHSRGRTPICPYCASGDSHQCRYYREHGIMGLQGAMAEYIAMPAVNCVRVPESMPAEEAALVEPLGCVTHANDRLDRAPARYTFGGDSPIRNVLIFGSGPAGLLFLQFLRKVRGFDGLVLAADLRDENLKLAVELGGTPVNVSRQNLAEAIRELTHGERIHLAIDACGAAGAIEEMPGVLAKQGTVLLYGGGHYGKDLSIIDPLLFLEPTFVVPIGASGGFDSDGRPTTYRRSLETIVSGQVKVAPFITHRYHGLDDVHNAFERDFSRPDYIKGVLDLSGQR